MSRFVTKEENFHLDKYTLEFAGPTFEEWLDGVVGENETLVKAESKYTESYFSRYFTYIALIDTKPKQT